VGALAREAEWEEQEAHNDVEVTHWVVDPPDGWGNTRPTSPIHEGWPGALVDKHVGIWPSPSKVVPTRVDSWPDVGNSQEGHTACRF
jgi:hypothetical protein